MIYSSAQHWRDAPKKRLLVMGMSGLGKTHLSALLRDAGGWFHYSIDYRIGTRYLGEAITDNAKHHAMQVPFLRDLLLTDSIYIGSNITFDNLTPVSTYLGKPGDPSKGGLPIEEYRDRQMLFRRAEEAALLDTGHFIERAEWLYDYPHFICDTGGSICEWVNPDDPADPIMSHLCARTLILWIEGSDAHTAELIRRFDKAPKPMSYQPEFLGRVWSDYLDREGCTGDQVDPDAFIRWTYAQALAHRQPRYRAMADRWGLTVKAEAVADVRSEADVIDMVADVLAARDRRISMT
ncbi:ATPase [Ponticoccus sp. SC2-23]|uniref:ATPase n=1 Tax=Alexandriicola marinus TaxID=2081710 RepID=UPI000FD975A7|nr:ATPase [Alexandriicola marinus]MBM1218802.1 ATPase [Ponticoccus sp. SC6-9]MBM1224126.1 ATPase [Ponticoccus sp. SC6-15]MBM1230095.1 ATPase [Ponticoccus sp. SC6-38]MBM1233092.1 ATPase [Ponticoccus sp. SC6-45]MBM1236958.1 ATPase [Ponticoccus sp. SC6-49]MBM1242103.1 ATPase [Ponticoccus sp. SC2-64]MBM1246616.1 ATPase [Ponticoccus sp. SC6-42]MBM1251094.1 ATPase [Ponticoccus sp. SC6-33]MBM1254967.1 ATPase [Ponticoccus sp. SC6-60]MBM1259473.1 ATPase [Ponticoccus sp. SC6-31]MBM1263792.1 ATPase